MVLRTAAASLKQGSRVGEDTPSSPLSGHICMAGDINSTQVTGAVGSQLAEHLQHLLPQFLGGYQDEAPHGLLSDSRALEGGTGLGGREGAVRSKTRF